MFKHIFAVVKLFVKIRHFYNKEVRKFYLRSTTQNKVNPEVELRDSDLKKKRLSNIRTAFSFLHTPTFEQFLRVKDDDFRAPYF